MSDLFRVEGLEAFTRALEGFVKVAEADVTKRVQTYASNITYNLVMGTPQFSGAAASAWRVGIGSPAYITEKPHFDLPAGDYFGRYSPFSMRRRNMEAVNEALSQCGTEIATYQLQAGSLYITNGLDYAQWFPSGQYAPGQALRTVNLPQRAVAEVVRDSLGPKSILRF